MVPQVCLSLNHSSTMVPGLCCVLLWRLRCLGTAPRGVLGCEEGGSCCLRLRDLVTGPMTGLSWHGSCSRMGLRSSSLDRDSSDRLDRYSCTRASPKLKMLSEDFPGDAPSDELELDCVALLGVWTMDEVPTKITTINNFNC